MPDYPSDTRRAPAASATTAPSRERVFLLNLALLVMTLAVVVLAMEAGARLLAGALGLTSYMQYDELVGWAARPGSIKRHQEPSARFDVTYVINGRGLRGREHDPAARPRKRIVLLGDSNGFGWGIAEGQHLSALLEERLPGVEAVNLSLAGYATDQELLRFRRDGVAYHPDVVLLQVTPNDFDDLLHPFANQKPKPHFELGANGALELRNVPVAATGSRADEYYSRSIPLPFRPWLEWNSYAYNFLNAQYFTVRRRFESRPTGVRSTEASGFAPRSVALFQRLLAELEGEIRKSGAIGLVVHAAPELTAARVFATALPVVDASPRFIESRAAGREPWYPDGYHWNPAGHSIVADEVIGALKASGALD